MAGTLPKKLYLAYFNGAATSLGLMHTPTHVFFVGFVYFESTSPWRFPLGSTLFRLAS